MHEERGRLKRLRDKPADPRAFALSPTMHLHFKSNLALPRRYWQRIRAVSTHHQRDDAAQAAAGIWFTAYIESVAIDGDLPLPLWILLLKTAEQRFPRRQQCSATAHQGTDASASMPHIAQLSERTEPSGQHLGLLRRALCSAWSSATSINPHLVVSFSAPRYLRHVTDCRSLPQTYGRPSVNANAPGLGALLYNSPQLTTRPPGKSSFTKPPAQLVSCGSTGSFTLPVHITRALPEVVHLALEDDQLSEYLLLALGLDLLNQWLQRSQICLHGLQANRRKGLGNKALAAVKLPQPLVMQSIELFLNGTARYREQDGEETLNAVTQPSAADHDERERLNAVTQSLNDEVEEEDGMEDSMYTPTQSGERQRRLLSGPTELSFDQCEVPQPESDYKGGDDDNEKFCAPAKEHDSPLLNAHALLKYRRDSGSAVQEVNNDDMKRTLSPTNTTDETPPPFPGFVHQTDPEDDDGDASIVAAQPSPSLLDITGATVYGECVAPRRVAASPVIGSFGKTLDKPPIRGMSLKKPTCDTVPELSSDQTPAGAEWMQQQQRLEASSQS